MPIENDLANTFSVLLGQIKNHWFLQNIKFKVLLRLIGPSNSSKRGVGYHSYSKTSVVLHKLVLNKVGVTFNLVANRFDSSISQDIE